MATAGEPVSQFALSPRSDVKASEHEDGLSAFVSVRSRLFGIAYRMLGRSAEAEDIVQDVWLRWQSADRRTVDNPPAFLATTTTRLCINFTQSAHTRRETHVDTWLPELEGVTVNPLLGVEQGEALAFAVLQLQEKLSPTERAAYVLLEAFDYSYRKIADLLQMEDANVRQLVSRARKHIRDGRRKSVSTEEHRRFLETFRAAAQKEDLAGLEGLLVEDIVSYSYGIRSARAERARSGARARRDSTRPRLIFPEVRGDCRGRGNVVLQSR